MKNLSREQVVGLEKAFKEAKTGREKIRFEAVWLLARGYKRKEVLTILGISQQALGSWVTQYHKLGLSGLNNRPQPGNHHKLTKVQKDQPKSIVTTQTPQKSGLDGQFWSIESLAQLVNQKFGVNYQSKESYRALFHYCGFSFHKPRKVNLRQSEHMQVRFEETLKKDLRTGVTEKIRWSW